MEEMIIKGRYTVKPAKTTWTGSLSLSELDQFGSITHFQKIYFYRPPENWLSPADKINTTLRESLSQALVPFYPLAGRLSWIAGGRLELDCNAMGVQFIEAKFDKIKLDEYLDEFSPLQEYHHLIPSVDYSLPLHELPVMIVQLTRFACGGISITLSLSHAAVDGQSTFHFFSEWAALARGEALGTAPFIDRKVLRAGDPPSRLACFDHEEFNRVPKLLGQDNNNDKETINIGVNSLRISKEQVEKLKNMANEGRPDSVRAYTRYEALTGHVWRCACKARNHRDEQATCLAIYVDVRNRVEPPLPSGYFGNAVVSAIATSSAGELMSKPLSYATSIIREAISKITSEYIWSYIDQLKNQSDLREFQDVDMVYGNPNFGVGNLLNLPMYGIDFGWGKEFYIGIGRPNFDGDSLILKDSIYDGSLIVGVSLQDIYMDSFNYYFYSALLEKNGHSHNLTTDLKMPVSSIRAAL